MPDFKALEIIDVRLKIDTEKLTKYLHANGFPAGDILIKQFNKGQSNPTYFLQASDDSKWVLRKKPPGKLLQGAHQINREFRVMKALENTPVPVPKMLMFCQDESVLGTQFYVMEFVEGRVLEDVTLPDCTPAERRQIYDSLNDVLGDMHDVDFKAVGLEGFGKETGYIQRQLKTWGQQYRASDSIVRQHKDHGPHMDQLLEWLLANVDSIMSSSGSTSIAHGDYRIGNVIVHQTEPRVVAVLDWELSTIGEPLADLAYCCQMYYAPYSPHGVGAVPEGMPTEEEFVARYLNRRGINHLSPQLWTFLKAHAEPKPEPDQL